MKSKIVLVVGDAVVILLVVLIGLSFHQSDPATRLKITFLPFYWSWLLTAWALGLYSAALTWRQLWRVPLAAIFAAPLGAVVRSAWLGSTVVPVFAAVMAGVLTLAMLIWRVVFIFFTQRQVKA